MTASSNYTWTCAGGGTPAGTTASCSANKTTAVNGSCGGSANTCNTGSASAYNAGSCGGTATWSCVGANGGSTASCSAANGPCAVNGSCGGSGNTCNTGTPSGYSAGSCGGSQTWSCVGANGGTTASCSIANGACSSNGACGGAANTCTSGTPSGYNAGSCGGSATWTCLGSNGGGNASCSSPNGGCPVTGSCGSANGGTFTSAPSSGLCNSGSASAVSGSGPWSWSCNGSNGGGSASCSANSGPLVFRTTDLTLQEVNNFCINCSPKYTPYGGGLDGNGDPSYGFYEFKSGDGSYPANNTDNSCVAGFLQTGPFVIAGTVKIGTVSQNFSFSHSPRDTPVFACGNGTYPCTYGGYGEHYTDTFSVPAVGGTCTVTSHFFHYCGRSAGIGTHYDKFPSTTVVCKPDAGGHYLGPAICNSAGVNYSTAPTAANCQNSSSISNINRSGDSTTGSYTWTCTDSGGGTDSCAASWAPSGGGGGGGGGGGCFTAETKFLMADGTYKAVSALKPGDKVKGQTGINTLERNDSYRVRSLLYRVNGSEAYVTANHPFYTKDGWKAVDYKLARKEHPGMEINELKIGDVLLDENGKEVVLKTLEAEDHGWNTVYNPSFNGDHTYYAHGLLMHNIADAAKN